MPQPERVAKLIPVTCPGCGFRFRVEPRFAGTTGTCPATDCDSSYRVGLVAGDTGQPGAAAHPNRTRTASPGGTTRNRRFHRPAILLTGTAGLALLAAAFLALGVPGSQGPGAAARVLATTSTVSQAVATPAPTPKPPDPFPKQVAPFLKVHCVSCHGPDTDNGGVRFDKYRSTADLLADRKVWEKTLQFLELGAMPPPDAKSQPDSRERRRVTAYLEKVLFAIDCEMVRDPGRVTIRRLNRAEYNNTIRDLLGVDFKPAEDFPSDDVGEGFDNIGDVLSISPLLIEKYLDAAESIASKAIVQIDPFTSRKTELKGGRLNQNRGAKEHGDGSYGLYSVGHVGTTFQFPANGNYLLRTRISADQAGPDPARIRLDLDDKPLKTFDVKGKNRKDIRFYEHRLRIAAGARPIRVHFLNDYYKPDETDPKLKGDRNAYVFSIEIVGPLEVDPADLPASHRQLIRFVPDKDKQRSPLDAARRNLLPFLRRAFRHPVSKEDCEPFAQLVSATVKEGESFTTAMQVGVQAILVSPHFLFRVEQDRQPDNPDQHHRLSDFELATRLSYFLWSSMPDEELLTLAEKDQLHRADVLEKQVERMLRDKRAVALVDNFASQWLNLRILDELVPDPKLFPQFNDRLRSEMQTETRMFFDSVLRDNRSIVDLLDGRFTFVNESLAKFYGIEGVQGEEFRRIDLPGDRRAGVLTHASILTLTSNSDRTSPVKRGKWILENILDMPPPPPPPNVPELEQAAKSAPDAPLRKQLELHREKASCAICHRQMDALGFGFENFDAIGRWRDMDGKHPVDATGTLPGNDSFRGAIELIGILKKRKERFCRSLSRKLLVYALGRGLEFYDRCAVDKIIEACRGKDYRLVALIQAVVLSEPFRMRRGEGAAK